MGAKYKSANNTALQFHSATAVVPNVTVYLGSTQDALDLNARRRRPLAGLLRHLYVESRWPPGAGETFTFTVMVNGIATAITCQIAGAAATQADDLVNTVAIAAGDNISLQLVTSLNAAQCIHNGGIAQLT